MTAGLATAASGRELVPGDPEEVEALAARLAVLGDGLSEAAARLVDLDDGDWQGPASEAFGRAMGDQPERYARAGQAFATATVALCRFADVLRDAQADADRALEWWGEAELATGSWQRAWHSYDAEVARRQASADPAVVAGGVDLARPSSVDPGAEWRDRAVSMAGAASARVDDEARSTAAALAEAEQGAPDQPGFWSSLWGGIGEFAGGLWASTGGAVLESVGAALDDPGGFVSDFRETLYDHLAFWNRDSFRHTWAETGKDLVAWDDWVAGNPARALGRITGTVVLGLGAGKVVLRLLRGRGRADGASKKPSQRTPEQNRQHVERFDDAPAYERIHRTKKSDRHILGGEGHGNGGHRAGTGFPDKTEFPDDWSDQRILDAVDRATQNPVDRWGRRDFSNGNTNFNYPGRADGLKITVVVDQNGRVVTAAPNPGQPGVYRNPVEPKTPPDGASRPVWTRQDGTGADGYWTWKGPGGDPLYTDRGGWPLPLDDNGVPVPPQIPALPPPPIPPAGSEG